MDKNTNMPSTELLTMAQIYQLEDQVPPHVLDQLKTQCLDNLRLSVTGPLPTGYYGPELPDHMIVRGTPPSRRFPRTPDVKITPVRVQESVLTTVVDDSEFTTQYALIGPNVIESVVQLNVPSNEVRLPQQPFQVHFERVTIDCLTSPVSVSCNRRILRMRVSRHRTFKHKPDKFYFSSRAIPSELDAPEGFETPCMVRYLDKTMVTTMLMIQAYKSRACNTTHIRHRHWGIYDEELTPKVLRELLVTHTRNGEQIVGPFVFNYRSLIAIDDVR